jgi:hypothetical protein
MEIIHAYIPPEVEGWRSVEETLVAASTPFLSCAAPSSPFALCFSAVAAFYCRFSRLPGLVYQRRCLLALVCFLTSFFHKCTASIFLPLLFSFPNLLFVFWALVVEGLV